MGLAMALGAAGAIQAQDKATEKDKVKVEKDGDVKAKSTTKDATGKHKVKTKVDQPR